jgi:CDP-paratose 2-epimerase
MSGVERRDPQKILITGGAGFIGTNLAAHLLNRGVKVRILDSLARSGAEKNLDWLKSCYGEELEYSGGDVRDSDAVRAALKDVSHVFHFAAQVAVTSSLIDPLADFSVNAQGTLNVLEAMRACATPPSLVFSSTNKVYGALDDIGVAREGHRYTPQNSRVRKYGVSETRSLDFHSPYGCSKGAAEQYVLDYSRSYGLRTLVLRMSCIYGPHQHGNEDQGWVAHFLIRALAGEPITIYGDGMQVRDILFVEDFVAALITAQQRMDELRGCAFNIGGGPANSVSLIELIDLIARLHGARPALRFEAWRTGDQKYYVSDTSNFEARTGWHARTSVHEGVAALMEWLVQSMNQPLILPRSAVG